ncbi:MAG: 30S ribosomal protein S4 [Deltaproteobacteria bacterium GWC2_56_8]|nr:MAG: 30S ribosomal protein S4 [Deltaproteobacteria bacterium GWB2_55_19]OGP32840.1 MAG: 30S ribosomal protein S4 [Deltaproteobacteria bacterium GWC2_56_8]
MARYLESVCKMCRREGMKLFFKADRCYTDKCAFERRSYAPGQHGQGRGKVSEYALQLREKQKVKRVYGLLESQFKGTFRDADRAKGITGENLVTLLERRLDNAVYRLGFAGSRAESRMMVTHGYIRVNGRKVDIPSFRLKTNDFVEIAEKKKKEERILANIKSAERHPLPEWLSLDKDALKGTVTRLPRRDDTTLPMHEQLIVELYSK